ncbi:MAG: ABC transporter permease [Burkholderiales bacterium]|nr:ABC transporter permease [Burkholderiales bacterium]
MNREGSPWTGLGPVFGKEFADQLGSARMRILEILVLVAAIGAVYVASQKMRATISESPIAFLQLFTTAEQPLPSFVSFLGFFVPLMAVSLGFDAVNGELSRGTLGRVLAQPIYRDALLMGKFLAALAMLALVLVGLWLVTTGFGILVLGLPPGGEEVGRGLLFLLLTLFYAGVWLSLALLFSLLFRQPSASAMVGLGVWIFFALLWPIFSQYLAQAITGPAYFEDLQVHQAELATMIARVSPSTLYAEAVQVILHPSVRSLGPVFYSQLDRALVGSPLPLIESLSLVWPQTVALLSGSCLLFALAYVVFQRREIRA